MNTARKLIVLAILAVLVLSAMPAVKQAEACGCYVYETAWSAGARYVEKGNWATYTPYPTGPVDLIAAQTTKVGTVTFKPVSTGVEITIALYSGWSLAEGPEPVKIQGYDSLPSGNPSPGQFTTYKGNSTVVTVSPFLYYGVHVDVRHWVSPCPYTVS